MKNWQRVQGSQVNKPSEFDTTSSPTTVYQRKNIQRIEIENMDGTKSELWEYDERTMTHEEYSVIAEIVETQKDIAAIEDVLCSLDVASGEA